MKQKEKRPTRLVTVSGGVTVEEAAELARISKRPYTKSWHVGQAVSRYLKRRRQAA